MIQYIGELFFGGRWVKWYETESLKLVIEDIDQDAVLLLYLAEKLKADLRILLFLYDKYGKDIWFFFYMFAGVVVKFPSTERFLRIIRDIQTVVSGGEVSSAVGKFAKNVVEKSRVELDLRDKRMFPLGLLGVYESDDDFSDDENNGGD
jgi:hypothetical protein